MTPAQRATDGQVLLPAPTDAHGETASPGTDRAPTIEADSVAEPAAALFKALGDPRRLQLVALVRQAPDGELCFCDLLDVFPVPQSSLSHHLQVLVTAGVLERERRGTWSWYRLRPDALGLVTDSLSLDGRLHRALRREHAANPKLIATDTAHQTRCAEPGPDET